MVTPIRLRVVSNQRWIVGSATVSMGPVTRWPTRCATTIAGTSMPPKCMPTTTTGRPDCSAFADGVGRLDDDPVQGLLEVHAADLRDLEVVADRVAETSPDQQLERVRVGGRPAREARAAPLRIQSLADTAQVGACLGGPCGCEPVPQLADALGRGDERRLGEDANEPRGGQEQGASQPSARPPSRTAGPSPPITMPGLRPCQRRRVPATMTDPGPGARPSSPSPWPQGSRPLPGPWATPA